MATTRFDSKMENNALFNHFNTGFAAALAARLLVETGNATWAKAKTPEGTFVWSQAGHHHEGDTPNYTRRRTVVLN